MAAASSSSSSSFVVGLSSTEDKVIVFLDLDCFFCQVEAARLARDNPGMARAALAVEQHGDLISVSHEARARGVLKHMTPEEARRAMPEVVIVHVPKRFGNKVSYGDYLAASEAVFDVVYELVGDGAVVQKLSIDEALVDVTRCGALGGGVRVEDDPKLVVVGGDVGDVRASGLLRGVRLGAQLRAALRGRLGFDVSVGVARTPMLARVVCKQHKPNGLSVLLPDKEEDVLAQLPIERLPDLGNGVGLENKEVLLGLGKQLRTCGDVQATPHERLRAMLGDKAAKWLEDASRGRLVEPVEPTPRRPQRIAQSMSLRAIRDDPERVQEVMHWVSQELAERLQSEETKHKRYPGTIIVSHRQVDQRQCRKSIPVARVRVRRGGSVAYDAEKITAEALAFFKSKVRGGSFELRWVGATAEGFVDAPVQTLERFMRGGAKRKGRARGEQGGTKRRKKRGKKKRSKREIAKFFGVGASGEGKCS